MKAENTPDETPTEITPAPSGEAPPAAKLVSKSSAKESDAAETVKLKQELEEERAGRKADKAKLAELAKPVIPAPQPLKNGLLDGCTFFS